MKPELRAYLLVQNKTKANFIHSSFILFLFSWTLTSWIAHDIIFCFCFCDPVDFWLDLTIISNLNVILCYFPHLNVWKSSRTFVFFILAVLNRFLYDARQLIVTVFLFNFRTPEPDIIPPRWTKFSVRFNPPNKWYREQWPVLRVFDRLLTLFSTWMACC